MKRLRFAAGAFAALSIRTLVVGLLALSPGLVAADDVVYFVNGKAMMVKSVEKGPKFYVLEVEGGGKIGVPTEQIDRIEPYEVQAPGAIPFPAPVAVPAQPSGVPAGGAVPTPVPAAQGQLIPGVGMSPLPAALAAPASGAVPAPGLQGPGVGGRTEPGQPGLGGLKPLSIGGAETYGAPPMRPQPGGMGLGGGPGGSRFMNPNGQMGRAGLPGRGMPGRPGGRGRMMRGSDQPAPQAQQTPIPAPQATPSASTQPQTPVETSEPEPNVAPPEDGTPTDDGGAADQGSS